MHSSRKVEKLKAIVTGLHQVASGLADLLSELDQPMKRAVQASFGGQVNL